MRGDAEREEREERWGGDKGWVRVGREGKWSGGRGEGREHTKVNVRCKKGSAIYVGRQDSV